jgi:hypothetical protein
MGTGLDMASIRMIVQCVMLVKPVIIPMVKEAIKNVKIQKQGNKN